MKLLNTTKKKIAAVAVAAAVVGSSGLAFAYWTTSGSGTGTAGTGTSAAVTVTQLGSVTGLVPGGPSGAVDFAINNTASFNQYITGVSVAIASVTGASATPAVDCTPDDFTLVQPTATYGDLTPGVHNYQPSGATLALKNTTSNQDDCKGATVALTFTAS